MKRMEKDRVLKAIILAGFALWLAYLLVSGRLELYITPKLAWLTKLSAVLLIILAGVALMPSSPGHGSAGRCCEHGHAHHDHSDHAHSPLSPMKVMLFVIPLLLGFTVEPQALNSLSLANSVNTLGARPFYVTQFLQPDVISNAPSNISTTTADKPSSGSGGNIAETDLVQLAMNDNPDQIYNQHYRLSGFVYKDPGLAQNQFVITRFVITCCIVDAQPIGIIVESPEASDLKADTWLELEGVLQKRSISGSDKITPVHNFQAAENTAPYLVATKIKVISAPQDPYLTVSQ